MKVISLVCNEAVLAQRLQNDIDAGCRHVDIIERSQSRLPLYDDLNTIKIDVSSMTPDEVAELIARL